MRRVVRSRQLIKPVAKERLHCFDESTGRILWVYTCNEKYGDWAYDPERGSGPTATPIVDRDRVYFVGANGWTHCLEANTGRQIWEKNIGREYEVAEMSCRPSPLIDRELLIVFTGAKPGASVLALNKETGKEVWKALDDHVSNSSPILQGEYIYGARGYGELVCLEAASGKQNWSTNSLTAQKNGASINITPQGTGFFLFTDEGNLVRAQLSPSGYREISRTHLMDPTWPFMQTKFVYAPPAFAKRRVFARSEAEVVCGSLEATP